MRFYTSSRSYPEFREIDAFWTRQRIWLRAFLIALRTWRMWTFFTVNLVVIVGAIAAAVLIGPTVRVGVRTMDPWCAPVQAMLMIGAAAFVFVSSLSWGGELMRPHLRRASARCREACPICGHLLSTQLARRGGDESVQCPECGRTIAPEAFREPFRLP